MSVYKRGGVYWYKFLFQKQLIRESANTNSKTVAREAERARRRDLELAVNRISRRERMPLFPVAAQEWLETKRALATIPRCLPPICKEPQRVFSRSPGLRHWSSRHRETSARTKGRGSVGEKRQLRSSYFNGYSEAPWPMGTARR